MSCLLVPNGRRTQWPRLSQVNYFKYNLSLYLSNIKSESHIRCIYDDNLAPLDFKFNLTGLCYVAKLDLDADLRQYLIEIKKKLEKIHKVNTVIINNRCHIFALVIKDIR